MYRFIIMRRLFALTGTVFMLRCVTMLITSLSVPGEHLTCVPQVKYKEALIALITEYTEACNAQ